MRMSKVKIVSLLVASLALSACGSTKVPVVTTSTVYVFPPRVACPEPPAISNPDAPNFNETMLMRFIRDLYKAAYTCHENVKIQDEYLDSMRAKAALEGASVSE